MQKRGKERDLKLQDQGNMTPAGKERFQPGSRVILHSLRANEFFNNRRLRVSEKLRVLLNHPGSRGEVLKRLENAHRPSVTAYEVCLTDGQLVKARQEDKR